ncbi:hypothetical protein SUGI_0321120 [Cryptomeria japonica]|nr:hypothetical protein SUGI_0321120 [Cryptomeria japonica]
MEEKTREMPRIVYPCAACKIQRRKCGDECILAPYFPPKDPHKFLVVHKFFGTSNIVKTLKDIPAERRSDAVTSLKQVSHLQSQLATVQAELLNTQANLQSVLTGFCNAGGTGSTIDYELIVDQNSKDDLIVLQNDENPSGLWNPW